MAPDSVAWSWTCSSCGDASRADVADSAEQPNLTDCTLACASAATQRAVVRRIHCGYLWHAYVALRASWRSRPAGPLQQLHLSLPRLRLLGLLPNLPPTQSSLDCSILLYRVSDSFMSSSLPFGAAPSPLQVPSTWGFVRSFLSKMLRTISFSRFPSCNICSLAFMSPCTSPTPFILPSDLSILRRTPFILPVLFHLVLERIRLAHHVMVH